MPPPPPIPAQYLHQVGVQHSGRLNAGSGPAFAQQGNGGIGGIGSPQQPVALQPGNPATYLSSPVDVPTMIAQKGYNPATFDTKPPFVGLPGD
jgi:YTH domain-containing family protein